MEGAQKAGAPWVENDEPDTVSASQDQKRNLDANGVGEELRVEKRGTIKWFDATRGFGFLVADDGSGDVLIHFSVLREHSRRMLPEGATVVCDVVRGNRGLQASRSPH